MNLIYDLIINIIDYLIIFKYFKSFSEKRTMKKKYCTILFCGCIILISVVNQFHNPNVNLILCILMIYLYSCSFSYSISYHIILPVLYIGFGIVAELIGFFVLNFLGQAIPYFIRYYGSSFICEIIRFLIVYAICKIRKIKFPKLSFDMSKYLVIIPLTSVCICCIAMNIIQNSKNNPVIIMCLMIIVMTISSNVLMFKMFVKVTETLSDNYEKEMLLQEAQAKEQYYNEVEKSNKEIRRIKHDLKNMLLAICSEAQKNNEISKEIYKIINELDASNKKLYTSNIVINTIINHKMCLAENLKIKTYVNIKVPKSVNLDYKDAGILLGNILDNAIESCKKINMEDRWIKIDIIYKKNTMFIKICNSKIKELVNIKQTSKHDVHNHGIGVSSIENIVNKYGGYVEFIDKGEEFEVAVSLYGI